MIVAFIVPSLTDLRYLIPFGRALRRHLPELDQTFHIQRSVHKYNGLSIDENYATCLRLLNKYCPWATIHDGSRVDFVVQVEINSDLECGKRIAIQHGFDAVHISRSMKDRNPYGNVQAFVCPSDDLVAMAKSCGVECAVAAPASPVFWDPSAYDVKEGNEKTITVFYPDAGDNETAATVIQFLEAADYRVIVKQRKKHQSIRSSGVHCYDQVWYPSEAISYPAISDFTIGFGSSAFIDLTSVGLNYINIDVHHQSYPWNTFVHPGVGHYVRIMSYNDVIPAITDAILTMQRVQPSCDDEQLKTFLLGLFR